MNWSDCEVMRMLLLRIVPCHAVEVVMQKASRKHCMYRGERRILDFEISLSSYDYYDMYLEMQ